MWVGSKASTSSSNNNNSKAIDNTIEGGGIDIQVNGAAVIEGIVCSVDNFKLQAGSLEVRASHDNNVREQYSGEISLTIPVAGNVAGGVSMSNSTGEAQSTVYHADNMIIAKGQLIIDIDGNARVSGVRLEGAEVLVRAQNLVVESLQDTLSERMRSMEMSIGSGELTRGDGSLSGKAQVSSRDAAWTSAVGSIIGTQVANIVVQQTLEIAGGLIANAEVDENGKLTDKGRVYVQAGSIVAKTLHDYDNGKSFGLGVSLSKRTAKNGDASYGVGMPVVCSFNDQARDLLPTIGSGDIRLTANTEAYSGESSSTSTTSSSNNNNNNNANISGLNRSLSSHIGHTTGEHASLKASIPVSEIWHALTTPAKPKEAPAAGEEPMTLGDYVQAGIENIASWFSGKDKEPATKIEIENKLSSLDEEILVNISKDSEKAPVINNATDREKLENIKAEVESKHHGKADIEK